MRIAWNKGLTKEDPRVAKYAISGRNKKRLSHLGKKHSEETKRKIGIAHIGRNIRWGDKISKTLKDKYKKGILKQGKGKDNPNWKGDNACYSALHLRVERARGKPSRCEVCKTTDSSKRFEWANLNGHYKDIKDYKRMCKKCHEEYHKSYSWTATAEKVINLINNANI